MALPLKKKILRLPLPGNECVFVSLRKLNQTAAGGPVRCSTTLSTDQPGYIPGVYIVPYNLISPPPLQPRSAGLKNSSWAGQVFGFLQQPITFLQDIQASVMDPNWQLFGKRKGTISWEVTLCFDCSIFMLHILPFIKMLSTSDHFGGEKN